MEEDEYKSTYNELTQVRCVFEKALTNNQAKCRLSKHFWLADREGYACKADTASENCRELLAQLRKNSLFVLKLPGVDGPLPHNMELRVQVGGLVGVSRLLADTDMSKSDLHGSVSESAVKVRDINSVVEQALEHFGSLDELPYSKIIQSVEQFQGRRRRQR